MKAVEKVQDLINNLTELLVDASKHDRGNHAAGARLRKSLQAAIHYCRQLRKDVQDERNARKNKK